MLLYALSRGGWYTVFIAFTLLAGLAVSTVAAVRLFMVTRLLGAYTGFIQSIGFHPDSYMAHSVTLQYQDDLGRNYDAIIKVSDQFAEGLAIGSKVPVFYAVENTGRIWLEPHLYFNNAAATLSIGLALICLSGVGLTLLWNRALAQLRLRTEGRLTHATVTERLNRDGAYGYAYRYRTETGETLTGTSQLRAANATAAIMPGATLEIVYDPRRPSRSAPIMELPELRG